MSSEIVWLLEQRNAATEARARALGLPVVRRRPATGFYLQAQPAGLTLQRAAAADHDHGVRVDLVEDAINRRVAAGRRSPLARALGLHRRPRATVLDTTCGLGRDSTTLAALNCEVLALERHAALYALLQDARMRARQATPPPLWLDHWTTLIHADATSWLAADTSHGFDIVYIDPMFDSPRRKAAPQKALAWLSELVGTDADVTELLDMARARATRRTVVKQHARADVLAIPDLQVHGKAVRYDIYLA